MASYAQALNKDVNYHQNAIDAAKAGDWEGVSSNLASREKKVAATGENYGKTSSEIYSELWNEYGAKQQANGIAEMIGSLKNIFGGGGSYAKALEEQKKVNEANVKKAVGTLEAQKTSTDKSYADMFKQLYLNKMQAKKNIGQQMAAQGLTGGAAESTMLGLNTQYQDALRQGEEGRISAQNELDKAITDARLTGDIQNAQMAADSAKEQATSYANILQNLITRQDGLDAAERQEAANNRAYAHQTAMALLQSGNMASDELLESAGINKADAAAIVASVKRGSGGSEAKGSDIYAAISALSQGTDSPMSQSEVKALWDAGYDFSDYAAYLPELARYYGAEPEGGREPMNDSYFNAHGKSIVALLQQGRTDLAEEQIESIWSELSDGQRLQLNNAIGKYGMRYEP